MVGVVVLVVEGMLLAILLDVGLLAAAVLVGEVAFEVEL